MRQRNKRLIEAGAIFASALSPIGYDAVKSLVERTQIEAHFASANAEEMTTDQLPIPEELGHKLMLGAVLLSPIAVVEILDKIQRREQEGNIIPKQPESSLTV